MREASLKIFLSRVSFLKKSKDNTLSEMNDSRRRPWMEAVEGIDEIHWVDPSKSFLRNSDNAVQRLNSFSPRIVDVLYPLQGRLISIWRCIWKLRNYENRNEENRILKCLIFTENIHLLFLFSNIFLRRNYCQNFCRLIFRWFWDLLHCPDRNVTMRG